jgi:hypothetical protein
MSSIPTSTYVSESAVIAAPLAAVWHLIKLPSFPAFWTKLEKAEHVKGTSEETDIFRWSFKDGTVLEIKQEAHSASTLNHTAPRAIGAEFNDRPALSRPLTIISRTA